MAGEFITPRWRPTFRRGAWIGALVGAAVATFVLRPGLLAASDEAALGWIALLAVAGFPVSLLAFPAAFAGRTAFQVVLLASVPAMWSVYGGGALTIGAVLVDRIRERLRGEGPT